MKRYDFDAIRVGTPFEEPSISVVIVTYNAGAQLLDCLDSLRDQGFSNYEVILVDNGDLDERQLAEYNLYYIALDKNYGPSYARNVGAQYAKGGIIAFLDDDGVAEKHWLANIAKRFDDPGVIAVRGKIRSKPGKSIYNRIAFHYDLGDTAMPWYLDIEGNCAVRTAEYLAVDGFNDAMFGAEGLDLSYRLDDHSGGRVFYDPAILIFHNYADGLLHFVRKGYRHGRSEKAQSFDDKNIEGYQRQFHEKESSDSRAEQHARSRTASRVSRRLARLSHSNDGSKNSLGSTMLTTAVYGLGWFSDCTGKLSTKAHRPFQAKRTP
jgi:glycosyltransferase involved in cell wall biosynthesis